MVTGEQPRADALAANSAGQTFGRVLAVRGSQTSVGLLRNDSIDLRATVGRFLGVQTASVFLIGVITEVTIETPPGAREIGFVATAHIDMMGEIKTEPSGQRRFRRGVTDYPAIGDPATLLESPELRIIYDATNADTIEIGTLQYDETIAASISL